MKLATYVYKGKERWGFVAQNPGRDELWIFPPQECEAAILRTAANRTNGRSYSQKHYAPAGGWPDTLRGFLELEEEGMKCLRELERDVLCFAERSDRLAIELVSVPLSQAQLLAPIPSPRLMWGLVQNSPSFFRKNIQRRIANFMPQGHQRPANSVVGPMGIMEHAAGFNVELGVVIGKKGKNISVEEALDYIAGYTVVTDSQSNVFYDMFTDDLQVERSKMFAEYPDWYLDATCSWAGKMTDAQCAMGPYITTIDEVGDVYDLLVYTKLNDTLRDRSHTAGTSLGVERTIQFYSSFATLYPGDVIHMGTVGTDGVYLPDALEIDENTRFQTEIEKLGLLSIRTLPREETARRDADRSTPSLSYNACKAVAEGQTELQGPFSLKDTRMAYTCYANYGKCEEAQGIKPIHKPRFLGGPNTSLAASGGETKIAARATTLDIGVELGVVVKSMMHRADAETAAASLLGYVPVISVSDRSFAENIVEPSTPQEHTICYVYSRWGDGYNVIGEVGKKPAKNAKMRLYANGREVLCQEVAQYRADGELAAEAISTGVTLFPADVILLGRTELRFTVTPEEYEKGIDLTAKIDGMEDVTVHLVRE